MLINIATYLLLLLNIILFLKGRKSIYVTIATLVLVFLFFAGMSVSDGDHIQYKYEFDTAREGVGEDILYTYFIVFARALGISEYGLFLGFLGFVEMLLIYGGMKCITTNPHALLAIAIPYIIPMMSTAVRFSLGLAVMVYATRFLIKNNYIYYLIFVIIATLFHGGLVFCVVYIFAFHLKHITPDLLLKKMDSLSRVAAAMLIITAVFYVFGASGIFLYVLSLIPASEVFLPRAAAYLETVGRNGPLLAIIIYVVLFVYVRKSYQSLRSHFEKGHVSLEDFSKACSIYSIVLLSSLVVPFMMAGLVFMRYLILPTILITFYMGRIDEKKGNEHNRFMRFRLNGPLKLSLFLSWLLPSILGIFSISLDGVIKSTVLYLGF